MSEKLIAVRLLNGKTRQVLLSECQTGNFEVSEGPVPAVFQTKFRLHWDIMKRCYFWPHFHRVFQTAGRLFFVEFSADLIRNSRSYYELSQDHINELLDFCNADEVTRAVWTKIPAHREASPTTPAPVSEKDDDRPDPEDFRVYYATEDGVRQNTIRDVLGVSQATVSRMRTRVVKWLAKGNKLPGLDDLPKSGCGPRVIATDPAKMARLTRDDDE
jgi:hypothetical protein